MFCNKAKQNVCFPFHQNLVPHLINSAMHRQTNLNPVIAISWPTDCTICFVQDIYCFVQNSTEVT